MVKKPDNWPKWGKDPHNPYSGKDRPAFNKSVYRDYLAGYVNRDGNRMKCRADRDGDCNWAICPQKVNRQSHCRLDKGEDDA